MKTNDIKEGMKLKFHDGRLGEMKDNKRGIVRTVEVYSTSAQPNDMGSCYISEISEVKVDEEWQKIELSAAHIKKLAVTGIFSC